MRIYESKNKQTKTLFVDREAESTNRKEEKEMSCMMINKRG